MSASNNFPKFIKASQVCRSIAETTVFEAQGFSNKKKRKRIISDTPSDRILYVRLQDIVEFQPVTEDDSTMYLVFVQRPKGALSSWAKITEESQCKIIDRYLKESQMDSNQDIIKAISDMKEFMMHLPK